MKIQSKSKPYNKDKDKLTRLKQFNGGVKVQEE